ncbi:GIN domain-containing protein [Asticcacaulis benevestitus]|uniref:Putative auto-transporter adhesin head GIN domain-containing protein n=1 Tax=Asticcacaulis benevestitus DSM 16100 = ATCC BAA-896 TaxID=1121022 RepID=V4PY73_9CAUL|nr:DUF2807 domain-containing protein [Asticcacaulis benevestitus]ESQ92379.1 hypothetical protein ABENE_08360 [Asticcacaulis benevestitus DSM 16100 = ATCC BAA-896]
MIRKLFLFSGGAFVLSLVCLAGAAALVSNEVGTKGWNWGWIQDGDTVRFRNGPSAKPEPNTSKTLAWSGGDLLAVDLPADVVYTQGPAASVTITGPQSLVDRIKLENGRLSIADGADHKESINFTWGKDGFDARTSHEGARITVTAPAVKRFEMTGSGDLDLRGYDQPSIDINIAGSGSVHAVGRTQTLKLNVSGSGDADLAALQAKDADVSVSGSGGADVYATDKAKIDISGSGNVDLATKPAKVDTTISGSGTVDQDDDN